VLGGSGPCSHNDDHEGGAQIATKKAAQGNYYSDYDTHEDTHISQQQHAAVLSSSSSFSSSFQHGDWIRHTNINLHSVAENPLGILLEQDNDDDDDDRCCVKDERDEFEPPPAAAATTTTTTTTERAATEPAAADAASIKTTGRHQKSSSFSVDTKVSSQPNPFEASPSHSKEKKRSTAKEVSSWNWDPDASRSQGAMMRIDIFESRATRNICLLNFRLYLSFFDSLLCVFVSCFQGAARGSGASPWGMGKRRCPAGALSLAIAAATLEALLLCAEKKEEEEEEGSEVNAAGNDGDGGGGGGGDGSTGSGHAPTQQPNNSLHTSTATTSSSGGGGGGGGGLRWRLARPDLHGCRDRIERDGPDFPATGSGSSSNSSGDAGWLSLIHYSPTMSITQPVPLVFEWR
jgi:hypothetical protein